MKSITILAMDGVNISSLDNPRRAFAAANLFLAAKNLPPAFKIAIAGTDKVIRSLDGVFSLRVDKQIDETDKTDLIIIPAHDGDLFQVNEKVARLLDWLLMQRQKGAEIATLCVGACLLAHTGLLNGKSCSTHWRIAAEFATAFPDTKLQPEKVITDEEGIYTSGGAFSSANLVLHLIEKYIDREAAIFCAKVFQVDIGRSNQNAFMIFQGQKNHQDEQVRQAQQFIEENYHERISVEQLTAKVALSRRSLERRFKKATSNTVLQYIQRVKIEAAKKYLEATNRNINEVMYDVGYIDNKSFRITFRELTGLSPAQYKNKYNKSKVFDS